MFECHNFPIQNMKELIFNLFVWQYGFPKNRIPWDKSYSIIFHKSNESRNHLQFLLQQQQVAVNSSSIPQILTCYLLSQVKTDKNKSQTRMKHTGTRSTSFANIREMSLIYENGLQFIQITQLFHNTSNPLEPIVQW